MDTATSEIINTADVYQIKLQSCPYAPEEITLKKDPTNIDNVIVIGKKVDRETKKPVESSRKFSLPYDVEPKDLKKIYASGGVLIIEANKKG